MSKIKGLLDEEMPREKLIKLGPSSLTEVELLGFKGINKAKATQIVSLFELSRRLSSRGVRKSAKISSSLDVFELTRCDFNSLSKERVLLVFVNSKNQVIKKDILFEGSINYSIIEPREIIKRVLYLDASGFFLLHNHPSGDTTPSEDDINITRRIKSICDKMNIRFLDHIVVGDNSYYSLYDKDII